MVKKMSVESENQDIEKLMRDLAKKLISENEVDVVIGYSKGTLPLSVPPIMIKTVDDVDKLIWNNENRWK